MLPVSIADCAVSDAENNISSPTLCGKSLKPHGILVISLKSVFL